MYTREEIVAVFNYGCMRKYIGFVLALVCVLGLVGCGNSAQNNENEQIIVLPSEVKEVEVSGYYNGSVINAGDFVVEDFDEFSAWVSQLSLEHRTFAEGETPSETLAGGNSYTFNINGGGLTFTYTDAGTTAYIVYDEEWYEVLNPSEPPFK